MRTFRANIIYALLILVKAARTTAFDPRADSSKPLTMTPLPDTNIATPTESTDATSPSGIVGILDTDAAYAKSTFPIKADDLIKRTKEILSSEISLGTKDGGTCLADDFEFCAAVVGPIGKDEYLDALGSFKLEDSFDIQSNFYGFYVDPLQTNRVWFFSRSEAKHVGKFAGKEATGKELQLPPQCFHIDFNESGLLKELGFYTVDRRQGNTGGLGGVFGYFYGIGKALPFPECQPFKPSYRLKALQVIGAVVKYVKG